MNFMFFISILLLIGSISLNIFCYSILSFEKIRFTSLPKNLLSFYKYLLKKLGLQDFYFLSFFTKNITKLLFALTALIFILKFYSPLISIVYIFSILIFLEITSRFLIIFFHKNIFYIFSFISSFFIIFFFPFSFLSLKILQSYKKSKIGLFLEEKIFNLFKENDLKKIIDPKILYSLATFKDKTVREVMIPRIKIFSIPIECTIRKASKLLIKKNYSRIPVFQEKEDNIVGIIMYKDILKAYIENSALDLSVEALIKPTIYVPENKKIFKLFQEFRKEKKHIATVVNEYGNAEGIITIEDILEELVGEIQDEYDIIEEKQFWKLSNGSWIVDAKMSIIDIEKKLNIKIPRSAEYETIGGFIFYMAKVIPKKGWILHLDEFEIEVLISNERCIEKIRITPIIKK